MHSGNTGRKKGWANPLPYSLALIWVAHIAFDRMIGAGLKYPAVIGATNLRWKDNGSDLQSLADIVRHQVDPS